MPTISNNARPTHPAYASRLRGALREVLQGTPTDVATGLLTLGHIMTDTYADALIETVCETPHGRLKASYILGDLEKLAPIFANEATRASAEAVLAGWQDGSDPLRKGLAMAWLSRARHALAPAARSAIEGAGRATGVTGARKAIGAGYGRVAGKAGDIDAASGSSDVAEIKIYAQGAWLPWYPHESLKLAIKRTLALQRRDLANT